MQQGSPSHRLRVLLAEGDALTLMATREHLSAQGHEVIPVTTGNAALAAIDVAGPFDAALIDLGLPDVSGETVMHGFWTKHPRTPVVIVTGEVISDARCFFTFGTGPLAVVTKPFSPDQLISAMREAGATVHDSAPSDEPRS